jgi:hypothetical protein
MAVDTNTMDRIDLDDNLPGYGLDLVSPQWSTDSKWLVLRQESVFTWAVNVETGTRYDLRQYQGYDSPVATSDTRFVGSLSNPNGISIFHLTDLDRGTTFQVPLYTQLRYLFYMGVSPDGKLAVLTDGYGPLSVVASNGSIVRHFKGSPNGILNPALRRCI